MAEGLKIIVGADITDAQAKLKKVVVDAKATGKEIEKSFGNARLPLGDIKAYTASIQNLKQNLSGVQITALNDGIQKTGSVAQAAVSGITGLAGSLAQGALAGVVLFAAHALVGLVKSLFDTNDAAEASERALKSYGNQIDDVKDSVRGLGEELQFLNQLAGVNAKIFKLADVTRLQGESVAQQQLTADLEDQRTKLKEIQDKIINDTELSSDDREKAEKKSADSIKDIDEKLVESRRKQTLIYRNIAEQRVEDADKAHKDEVDDYKKFLEALRKQIEFEEGLRQLQADILKRHFKESGVLNTAKARESVTVDINLSTLSTNFPELGQKISSNLKKAIEDGMKNNPILLEGKRRKEQGESDLQNMEKDAERAANAINGLLTPAFDGLFEAIKSGENPLKAFFEGLGQAVLQLIQKLIQAAITAAILSAILPGGGGGFSALFGKFLGMASGGLVSGPTLAAVGEGSGTSLSNPEVVAPLDQLKSLLGDIGGGGTQVVVMRTQISGNNLALVQARTSRRNKRLGARA